MRDILPIGVSLIQATRRPALDAPAASWSRAADSDWGAQARTANASHAPESAPVWSPWSWPTLAFWAQHIAQERLSPGAYREAYSPATAAYARHDHAPARPGVMLWA